MAVVGFGAFELDLSTGELTRQGRRVPLQDQPARVLGLLVMRSGQVVTRDEVRQALWQEHTFVEFEAGIAVAINKIRHALGDSASNPRFIETVPKHGYRFLADVHPIVTLEKARDIKDPQLGMIGSTARVDTLRDDPRFQTLLTCVGLAQVTNRTAAQRGEASR